MISLQQWGPRRGWGVAELVAAAVLLASLPLVDHLGWVILVPAALCAAGFGLRDWLLTPVLAADADGIAVLDGVRRISAGWGQVQRLRTVRDRRSTLLEIDLGEHVVVLSARRLGAPVEEVLAALDGLRVR
ncbi:MAG: PH domain-containing protein [Mycobacteriales bacterium]